MKEALDDKTQELIAIGASISAHCQPCLTYHVAKAKELGVATDLISAAIDVGYRVQKGATAAMREFANLALAAATDAASGEDKTHTN